MNWIIGNHNVRALGHVSAASKHDADKLRFWIRKKKVNVGFHFGRKGEIVAMTYGCRCDIIQSYNIAQFKSKIFYFYFFASFYVQIDLWELLKLRPFISKCKILEQAYSKNPFLICFFLCLILRSSVNLKNN